jgi:hypothetical protein
VRELIAGILLNMAGENEDADYSFDHEGYEVENDELATQTAPNEWNVSRFRDALGRTIEAHKCEYCGIKKPVKVWQGPDFSSPKHKESYHYLMAQVDLNDGRKVWHCNDCAIDIINKSS